MLEALKPRVVGHFDLVRLYSEVPGRDVREWKGVWERIVRNLEGVVKEGAWLECNTSALRKGLEEPYPCRVIAEVSLSLLPPLQLLSFPFSSCQVTRYSIMNDRSHPQKYLSLGGKFTLSDDSHAIDQVGTNYPRALTYLESLGVTHLWTFERVPTGDDKATLNEKSVAISAIRESLKM